MEGVEWLVKLCESEGVVHRDSFFLVRFGVDLSFIISKVGGVCKGKKPLQERGAML